MSRGISRARSGGGSRSSGSSSRSSGRSYGYSPSSWFMAGYISRNSGNSGSSGANQNQNEFRNGVKYKKVKNKKATLIVGLIFVALVIGSIVLASMFSYGTVMATSTSYNITEDTFYNEKYIYFEYKFELNGKEYSATSGAEWLLEDENHDGKVDQEDIDIYLSADNYPLNKEYEINYYKRDPYQIYESEYSSKENHNMPFIFLAIMFGVVALIILIGGINKYEVDQEYMKEQERKKAEQLPAGKIRCNYCRTILNETESKCTSCGAPIK